MKTILNSEIPLDERKVTDLDVFQAFDLSLPALASVQTALANKNISLAKKELISYFEKRTSIHFFYDYRSLPLVPIDTDSNPHDFQSALGLSGSLKDFCLYAGNQLMNNVYIRPGRDRTIIDLGPDYENFPHFNYHTDLGKKHRTLSDILVRGQMFEYLAILYHETGEQTVLDKFEEVLQVFFKHYPLFLEYTEPDASRFCLSEDRDVMSTGWLALTYISLFYTRIPYEINTDLAFELIKRIWFLGVQFRRFDDDTYRQYNHHMWERGLVPFMLSVLFPEITDFAPMQERGASVTRRHILDDFNEAGGYSEHSIPYWSGAALCGMIYRGIYLSEINHVPFLDTECKQRLDLSFRALALISPPQALYSSIGDNGGPMVSPILHIGERATGNLYCAKVLALRSLEQPTTDSSLPLDYADDRCGFFSSRNGYGQNANFILMSAKVNCQDSGHNHMDMLSLFITFRGQEFIGEAHARQLYQRNRMNTPHRGYLYNMGSHNTVLVYGRSIQADDMYANKWGVLRPDSPISSFSTYTDGCYVEAYHDAYTTCRHKRRILFHRQKGILLQDCIEHGNRLNAPHIQRWHLIPDVTLTEVASDVILLEKQGVTLLLLWTGNPVLRIWQKEDLRPEIVHDDEPLSTIIDATFSATFEKDEDIATVIQGLLILDVTEHIPTIDACITLKEKATLLLEEMECSTALQTFSLL